MSRKQIISDDCIDEVKVAYIDKCVPVTEIASWLGVTRQAVYKYLWRHGVDTGKEKAHREIKCDECGKFYVVNRAAYRDKVLNNGNKKNFCSDVCYKVYLENKDSIYSRHHQRIARQKVSEVFDLEPGNVVHHKDFDHFNTDLDNFIVFKSNRDHVKYHHQLRQGEVTVKPIWDGAEYIKSRVRSYSKSRQLGRG